jgi:perosamine synthetase
LDRWQFRRAEIAAGYDALLAPVAGLELPPRPLADLHAWHLYIVRVHREFGTPRDAVVERLAQAGIGSSVHFIPVHHQPYFRELLGPDECDNLPVADAVFPRLLSLPLHPGLSDPDVERVCEALADLAAR